MKIGAWTHLAALGITALVALGGFNAAYAITNGQPDGDAHPYVGIVVTYDDQGNVAFMASGVLLSPTVFLTAAHVIYMGGDDPTKVRIFVDEEPSLVPADGIEVSEFYTHPGFRLGYHGQAQPGWLARTFRRPAQPEPKPRRCEWESDKAGGRVRRRLENRRYELSG
jgi:hypothetical protein